MQYRDFGRTGWQISEISFGGWQIGGQWGAVDDESSIRSLLHAYERGVNLVDTAQMYGDGHSEEVIGESLGRWTGNRIFVATKVQPTKWPNVDDDNPPMDGMYPESYLRTNVEQSLRRLRVERLDLLQLHGWFPDGTRDRQWLETLHTLRLEGKIDKIGVSIRDYRPEEGLELVSLGLVDSVQVVFNLFEQRPAHDLFTRGESRDTAFIARVPFDSGSLIGHWTESTYASWPPESVPAWLFRGKRFTETLLRVKALKKLCAPYFPTLAEAAMRYTLSSPQVSTVIPGMLTPREIDMNVAYSDGQEFPAELLEQLPEHGWPRNFYK